MIRRWFWFMLGAIAGAYGALWARRTAEDVSKQLTPTALIEHAIAAVKALVRAVVSGITVVVETANSKDQPPTR